MSLSKLFTVLSFCFFASLIGFSQVASEARKSPIAISTYKYEHTYIKLTYGQPMKRNREIFGKLVPYGQIWRTGANEATELTTTSKIKIGGKILMPGTYTVFSIPDKTKWTIIFNSELGQWGNFKYNEAFDILRITAPVGEAKEMYESFTINFEYGEKNGAYLLFMWDRTEVKIPIEII